MPRGTTLRNVRIDDERWEALEEIAKSQGLNRSEQIRAWIDEARVMPPPTHVTP